MVHMVKDTDMLITGPILQEKAPFFLRNLKQGNRLVSVGLIAQKNDKS
jgi:hypothetical protein